MLHWIKQSIYRQFALLLLLMGFGINFIYLYVEYKEDTEQLRNVLYTDSKSHASLLALLITDNVKYKDYFNLWQQLDNVYQLSHKYHNTGKLYKIELLVVTDTQGNVVGSTDPQSNPLLKPYTNPLWGKLPPKGEQHVSSLPNLIDNIEESKLMVTAPVRSGDEELGTFTALLDYSAVNQSREAIISNFFYLLAISTVVTIVLLVVIARWLSEPLRKITRSLEKIGSGDVEMPQLMERNDEFKVLAEPIQKADRQIFDNTAKLHAYQTQLEDKVELKTQELMDKDVILQQQLRLAQMGEMISMIAHQWRQPLASISAICGTLTLDVMMDAYKKEFFRERLESISDLSQHLSSTIDDFRNFFKADKEKEDTTWEEMTKTSLRIIGPTLTTKDITLHESYECTETLHTSVNEIKQVILNLLKNAEDILLERQVKDATIWIRSYTKGEQSCLSIEDNGGGIPHSIIGKIFDPYFSTKTKKDGTGLGLYMSKTIVDEHCQGLLSVTNSEHGARFEVALPRKGET